jgi:hypothetical protein
MARRRKVREKEAIDLARLQTSTRRRFLVLSISTRKIARKGKTVRILSLSKPPIHLMDDLSAYPLKYLFVYLSLYLTPFYLCIRCSISVTVRQPVHLSV